MPNHNHVTLVGNLTRDVELRYTADGVAIGNLSLATTDHKGKTSFFTIVAFGQVATNAAKYLTKGRAILASGSLSQRTWEVDGQRRSTIEVLANTIEYLDKPKGE